MRIAVVILNYNGSSFLRQFLPGVIEHSPRADIVVADNGSTDDSVEVLRTQFPQVKLLQHNVNEGYAGGYNRALEQVDADYFILLNSDVEVTPGWIKPVVDFMDAHPAVAACQPKIKSYADKRLFEYAGASGGYIDHLGYPFCRGRIFDTVEIDEGQYDDTVEVFWATGACLFVRASAFRQCGGFDPLFFAHMEEIDLCWRMKRMGHTIYCCPQSIVYHVGGGTLKKENPHKTYLNFRNNLLMLQKNLTPAEYKKVLRSRWWLDMLAAGKFLASFQIANYKAVLKAHNFMRKHSPGEPIHSQPVTGIMQGSIVWQYYFKGKKVFSNLVRFT